MPAKKRAATAAAAAAPPQPLPAAVPEDEEEVALPQLFSAAATKPPPASDPPPAKRRLLDAVAPLLPASVDKRVAAAAARLQKADKKKTAKISREGGSAAAAPEEEEAADGAAPAAAKQVRNVVELRRSPANGRLYSKFRFFAHFGGYEEWDAAAHTSTLNEADKAAADEEQGPAQGPDGVWNGIVKRWSASHGFGFVTPDGGGEDVFVHVSALPEGHGLKEGRKISFEQLRGNDGKRRAIEGTVRGAGVVVCATTQKKIDHRKNGFVGVRKFCVVIEENDPKKKNGAGKGFCFHCGQRGHYSRNCPTGGGEKGDIARRISSQRKKEAMVTKKRKPGGNGGKSGKGGGKGGRKGGGKGLASAERKRKSDDGDDEIR